jgi:hypothetical protein
MTTTIKKIIAITFAFLFTLSSCQKEEFTFGEIKTPSSLTLTTAIAGVDLANPNGNGTGTVLITSTSSNAITYNIDFGDGKVQVVPTGTISYKYSTPGTNEFTVTVNAVGTGGAVSTISKKIKVFVAFEIPANIIAALTNGSSRTWVTDKDAPGHFGVGPATDFSPIWYSADPNSRDACVYDDEITFTKDANNNISMTIANKGQSFSIGAATAFYGFSGGDACLNLVTTGAQKLVFMNANSASTTANSTRIQFTVPGKGMINFGTGGATYEILSASGTNLHLRNIGIDNNSWYQKLKAK